MVNAPGAHEILAAPLQPGVFRVCIKCRSWFALVLISRCDDELKGSVATYRCRKCNATFVFAQRHPPGAI